jgi:hypothetical protein
MRSTVSGFEEPELDILCHFRASAITGIAPGRLLNIAPGKAQYLRLVIHSQTFKPAIRSSHSALTLAWK